MSRSTCGALVLWTLAIAGCGRGVGDNPKSGAAGAGGTTGAAGASGAAGAAGTSGNTGTASNTGTTGSDLGPTKTAGCQ